jgi:hypothetical protein
MTKLAQKRRRSTQGEQLQFLDNLLETVRDMEPPMTVRQVFYQSTVRGIVEKSEAGYRKVQRALVTLREGGDVEWNWIADNTRWMRKPRSYGSPEDAMRTLAASYRKALWNDIDARVEVWIEKDALAGVIVEVTSMFDVPLMVARGYASLSFLHSSATDIEEDAKPAFVYHLGDYDPSGQDAAANIERRLREFAPSADIIFRQIAVLPSKITRWNLPTRPTKSSDPRAATFAEQSVELDAITPQRLRALVRTAIERHMPKRQYEILMAAEVSEREGLVALAQAKAGQKRRP